MQFIKYCKVDYRDRLPETEFPARHGPDDPVPGIDQLWFELGSPVIYYGAIDGEFDAETPGILEVYSEADFAPILAARVQTETSAKRLEMDAARDAEFNAGMPYTFGDVDDSVQIRERDQVNLLAVFLEAQANPEGSITFRSGSDVSYTLTAAEATALSMAALNYIRGIYEQTWAAKDALDAISTESPSVQTLLDVRAVTWGAS